MSTLSTVSAGPTGPTGSTSSTGPAGLPTRRSRRCAGADRPAAHRARGVVAARPAAAGSRVHLTRRGRVVVVLGLLVAVLAVGFTLGHVGHAPAAEASDTRVLVVQPGDTLWSIAARVDPHQDTRRVVAQLLAMNRLSGASVQVGERLSVPA